MIPYFQTLHWINCLFRCAHLSVQRLLCFLYVCSSLHVNAHVFPTHPVLLLQAVQFFSVCMCVCVCSLLKLSEVWKFVQLSSLQSHPPERQIKNWLKAYQPVLFCLNQTCGQGTLLWANSALQRSDSHWQQSQLEQQNIKLRIIP